MKIYWDGLGLENLNSGIGTYGKSLFQELDHIGVHPTVVGTSSITQNFPKHQTLQIPCLTGLRQKLFYSKINWPNEVIKQIESDQNNAKNEIILHGLSNVNIPLLKNNLELKRVITIHDLIPILAPESVSKSYLLQFKYLLPKVIFNADAIICVSNWTKETLLAQFPEAESKTHVIHNGFDSRSQFKEKQFTKEDPIKILTVGRSEKYKNQKLLGEIVEAYPNLFQAHIITDAKGFNFLNQKFQHLIQEKKLVVETQISSGDLKSLYHKAQVYVHPSQYEGFGLPAAEALAHGTPVVYQSGSGIDEVVGNQVGIPISKKATLEQWGEEIQNANKWNNDLSFRSKIDMHLKQLPSWKDSAHQLFKLYKRISEKE